VTATPHDALFKAAFSKLRHARGLLRSLLQPELAQKLHWNTLRLETGMTVDDEALDEQRMDLLFSICAGPHRVFLYVLAEHQSTVDDWMVFRMLRYMVALWKTYRAQHPEATKLPAIIPLVVHHSETGWTAPVAFEDMLDADESLLAAFGPFIPRFKFLLEDLSVQSDDALRSKKAMTPGGRLAILSLKHGRDPLAVRVQVLGPDALSPSVRDVVVSVFRYIIETGDATPATLRAMIAQQIGRVAAEEIMTTADMLRSEGMREGERKGERKGKREGERKGKREVLLLLLRQRFGRLPATVTARIKSADTAELDTWLRRVVVTSSLDEVLAPVAQSAA